MRNQGLENYVQLVKRVNVGWCFWNSLYPSTYLRDSEHILLEPGRFLKTHVLAGEWGPWHLTYSSSFHHIGSNRREKNKNKINLTR